MTKDRENSYTTTKQRTERAVKAVYLERDQAQHAKTIADAAAAARAKVQR